MSDGWVINASPLILFARIDRLDLFEQLSPTIVVPDAVIEEVRAGQGKDPTAVTALSWAVPRRVSNTPVPMSVEHWDLGAGESSWVGGYRIARYGVAVEAARAAQRGPALDQAVD